MSEQFQHKAIPSKVADNDSLPLAPAEQDMVALIKNMQQQLVFLEKKIDILISQSQSKPSSEKHFSKPFRSFSRPYRRSDREHDNTSGEKSFDRGRHFEKRYGEESRGFDHKKKAYDNSRESNFGKGQHFEKPDGEKTRGLDHKKKVYDSSRGSNFGKGHHFEKRHDGEKRGFDQKKKPFYSGRKERG